MAPADASVLRVLAANPEKVLSRSTILRLSGLQHCSPRRCDGIMSNLRRMLGDNAIVTVRGRGWMLPSISVPSALALLSHNVA